MTLTPTARRGALPVDVALDRRARRPPAHAGAELQREPVAVAVGRSAIQCSSPLNVLKSSNIHTIIAAIEHVQMNIST